MIMALECVAMKSLNVLCGHTPIYIRFFYDQIVTFQRFCDFCPPQTNIKAIYSTATTTTTITSLVIRII